MATEPRKRSSNVNSSGDKLSYYGRGGALIAGFLLVILGAADAMFDPFPGPETALFTAGIGLIVIGITGRKAS
jgi:hypothetical protein